jgi:hypothetical protein
MAETETERADWLCRQFGVRQYVPFMDFSSAALLGLPRSGSSTVSEFSINSAAPISIKTRNQF